MMALGIAVAVIGFIAALIEGSFSGMFACAAVVMFGLRETWL